MDIFEDKENKILVQTKNMLKTLFPIYSFGLENILKTKDLLINDVENNIDIKYNKACLILLNSSIQHLESIKVLLQSGLYGDCFVLIRSLMSNIAMLQYLHFHPKLLDLFLKESLKDYQNNSEFKKNFNETAIEKDLESRGISSFKKSFQILSKTSHASSWGAQLYGVRGEVNQYFPTYGPTFDPEKATAISVAIVSGHYDLISIVLWHRQHTDLPIDSSEWDKVKANFHKLEIEISMFLNSALTILKTIVLILK